MWVGTKTHFFVHIFQQKIDKEAWLSLSYIFQSSEGWNQLINLLNYYINIIKIHWKLAHILSAWYLGVKPHIITRLVSIICDL